MLAFLFPEAQVTGRRRRLKITHCQGIDAQVVRRIYDQKDVLLIPLVGPYVEQGELFYTTTVRSLTIG